MDTPLHRRALRFLKAAIYSVCCKSHRDSPGIKTIPHTGGDWGETTGNSCMYLISKEGTKAGQGIPRKDYRLLNLFLGLANHP